MAGTNEETLEEKSKRLMAPHMDSHVPGEIARIVQEHSRIAANTLTRWGRRRKAAGIRRPTRETDQIIRDILDLRVPREELTVSSQEWNSTYPAVLVGLLCPGKDIEGTWGSDMEGGINGFAAAHTICLILKREETMGKKESRG